MDDSRLGFDVATQLNLAVTKPFGKTEIKGKNDLHYPRQFKIKHVPTIRDNFGSIVGCNSFSSTGIG